MLQETAINAAATLSPYPLYTTCPFSFSKMALGRDLSAKDFNNSDKEGTIDPQMDSSNSDNVDLEGRNNFGFSNKEAGGRIAPVLPHLKGYDFGSEDSGEDILGKQIELESENAIQYRTCSWQKVYFPFAFMQPI